MDGFNLKDVKKCRACLKDLLENVEQQNLLESDPNGLDWKTKIALALNIPVGFS